MIGIILGLVVMLVDAVVLWSCCHVASMADRAEEESLESGKEERTDGEVFLRSGENGFFRL